MSASRVRTPVCRSAAVGLSAALAAVGLAATAPAAESASTSIAYSCASVDLGPFTLPVVLDTNAPARMTVGQSAPVTLTASAVLPGAVAKAAASQPATAFDGAWTVGAMFGTSDAAFPQTIA